MFRSWTIDFDRSAARIEMADGRVLDIPMQPGSSVAGAVRQSRLEIGRRLLTMTLDDGDELSVELGHRGDTPPDVPVVYLDQLHWIALAQRLHAPEKLRESERSAAARLIELAALAG